jgi:hypothetical protein
MAWHWLLTGWHWLVAAFALALLSLTGFALYVDRDVDTSDDDGWLL